MMLTRGEKGWGDGKKGKGGHIYSDRGDQILGGEQTMEYTDVIL